MLAHALYRTLTLTAALASCLAWGCAAGSNHEATSTGNAGSAGSAAGGAGGGGTGGTGGSAGDAGKGGGAGDSTCATAGETRDCYDGDPALAGVGACALGTQTCEQAGEFLTWGACTGWVGPSAEMCDGVDNDCNGTADEGCCVPAAEVCDGVDNNCDGAVDEGCCVPSPEVCDGVDNDCNGFVDDGAGCGPGSCGGGGGPCTAIPIPPPQPLGSGCTLQFPPAATLPCPVPNPGTQYYVNASTGNDANDGLTPATAWATLCFAVAQAPAGSTLEVAEGDYTSGAVYVGKELTVKGGYDATFSTWDPDAHPSNFYGRLTLDHNAAVWGGFRMLGRNVHADSWSYMHHFVGAGTLVRNYIEIVVATGMDPNVLNLYAVVASACPGGVSVLRCNDIYVRSDAPQSFVSDAVEYGNVAAHQGLSVLDSNRVCLDQGGPATATIDGYGTCDAVPASIVMKNNVFEKAGSSGGSAVEFYGCGMADLSLTLTNNTIVTRGNGLAGYEGPPSVVHWKLTNNILFNLVNGSTAVDVGSGAVKIDTSEGNLTFGFGNNGISPAPGISMGDDTSGQASMASVLVNAPGGDLHLKAGGQGVGTGVNVFGLSAYGTVTTDIEQKPRPAGGAWDRGAYAQ